MTQCDASETTQDCMENSLKNLANIEGLTREQAIFSGQQVIQVLI